MKYWTEYHGHDFNIQGKKNFYDDTIYTFDIETTSYLILNNKILKTSKYLSLTKEEQEECEFQSIMYIWQLGINDVVYYGRTWNELEKFFDRIENHTMRKNKPIKKFFFVHNLSYEFTFLQNQFFFKNVFSR